LGACQCQKQQQQLRIQNLIVNNIKKRKYCSCDTGSGVRPFSVFVLVAGFNSGGKRGDVFPPDPLRA